MSLFKMPFTIADEIEKVSRNFFWEDSTRGKGKHLVNNEIISPPTIKLGLKVDSLKENNKEWVSK